MYKNQLQELAQRSCFNLPSYACIREGPDHAPRFKATVNFNGETFESPTFCTTLRQAEHAAAEVALNTLSKRGPSRSLAARVLDETGVYKNLLQETAHRAGLNLPTYTTVRSGPGHVPVFSCTVELAGMSFTGEPAKTKKQAQKNAAMAAWSALKQMSHLGSSSSSSGLESEGNEEQEQVVVARTLASLRPAEANKSTQNDRQRGRRRSAPARRTTKPGSTSISLYPMHYQSWNYSNFFPEMAMYQMYQMWQQEQASQQQSRLLTHPVAPTLPPGPHVVPFIQSIFQPEHGHYVPVREHEQPIQAVPGVSMPTSGPSLYFSNPLMPVPVGSRSQVTIQEIQEERTQMSEEWLHSDADGDGRKVNIQPNASGFSPVEAANAPVSGVSHADPLVRETTREVDKQKNVESDPSIRHAVQLEGGQSERIEWASRGSTDAGYVPRSTNPGHAEFRLRQLHGLDSSQSNPRPHHHPRGVSPVMAHSFRRPTTPAPVMIRTVGRPASSVSPKLESSNPRVPAPAAIRTAASTCVPRPWPRGMMTGGMPSNMMAPAVHIRSVVPVCAAPPARKIPETNQDGLLSGGERRTKEPEDVKASGLELEH
ncbi:double-stranded RNA-binding protein 2-like isoform X2 [Macadamia integrifolia]|uniref:double-stranded RNA-binding protein 2-like isoform X2 n=1 Tax=Macadamia integrifolia TaxID=60698 RepID=UPI001C4E9EC4|nr:double-stranded RNA-binding protein 2-like isoform X2 [Macadamia integrifolia]